MNKRIVNSYDARRSATGFIVIDEGEQGANHAILMDGTDGPLGRPSASARLVPTALCAVFGRVAYMTPHRGVATTLQDGFYYNPSALTVASSIAPVIGRP